MMDGGSGVDGETNTCPFLYEYVVHTAYSCAMGFANVVAFWRLAMIFYWLTMATGRLYPNLLFGRVRDSRNVYEALISGTSSSGSRSNDVMLITRIITFVLAAPRRPLY